MPHTALAHTQLSRGPYQQRPAARQGGARSPHPGTPGLRQQVCDCRGAYSEDCELEHQGEPMIWFEPVDAEKQHRGDGQDHDSVSESQHSNGPSHSAAAGIASWSDRNRRFA